MFSNLALIAKNMWILLRMNVPFFCTFCIGLLSGPTYIFHGYHKESAIWWVPREVDTVVDLTQVHKKSPRETFSGADICSKAETSRRLLLPVYLGS